MAGTPSSVHARQKTGSPVWPSERSGASPSAAGTSRASRPASTSGSRAVHASPSAAPASASSPRRPGRARGTRASRPRAGRGARATRARGCARRRRPSRSPAPRRGRRTRPAARALVARGAPRRRPRPPAPPRGTAERDPRLAGRELEAGQQRCVGDVRPNVPSVSSRALRRLTPAVERQPWRGLKPTTPQNDAGRITEPPVCVPRRAAPSRPPPRRRSPHDEPPGVRSGSRGLRSTGGS